MKNSRFLVLAMLVIFAMVVAGCAGQGEAGDQGANTGAAGAANDNNMDTVGEPGAQQTDMPGTGDAGETGGADTTGSGTDATGGNLDTGVSGSGTGQGTGSDASSGLSAGTDGTTGGGSGTTNTGGAGALSGNFMGRWNFAMLEGCSIGAAGTSGSDASGSQGTGSDQSNSSSGASGNMNASDTQTMTCEIDGDSYVIELRRGDAGSAGSLQEWAETDLGGEGAEDSGEGATTTVGNFDAVTFRLPDATVQDGEISGATCAARTYVWGMGNAGGAGNSDNAAGNSAANDNNAANLLIVTVYQTSGDECNAEQVMADFVAGFQGGEGSDMDGSTGSDSGTGSTTP